MIDSRFSHCVVGLAAALPLSLFAQDPTPPAPVIYEEVLVTGGKVAIRSLSGSASFIDEEAIRKFDATDINELLGQVPGVYIRFEDGYGLRPNIGVRGATSERSQKITLMEDGILIAPAPYSAPAAYYIPNVNRMTAVEVFKGASAIEYGPHTVGGALNMVTPRVPEYGSGELDLALGSEDFRKARVVYGDRIGQFGINVDLLHYGASGFKQLDSGGDTGFDRNDANLRLEWRSAEGAALPQQMDLKIGYADEDSDETYLGLTDDDFALNPDRRYIASELDHFTSEHRQIHLLHNIELSDNLSLFTTVYGNRFDRSWKKYDGFLDGQPPSRVLAFPNIFVNEMALIRGEAWSDPDDPATIIDITNNAREYGSQGAETRLSLSLTQGSLSHNLGLGLRYHHDYVERDHQVYGYWMTESGLVSDGAGEHYKKALNKAQSDAWSAFLIDEIDYGNWKINLGVRYESIAGQLDDHLSGERTGTDTSVALPGVGVFYQVSESVGLLAGVNKGFSPAGPAAGPGVDPEESVNYEYGLRYTGEALQADLIGFFSDYSNLLGRCRASDSGCAVGDEFNGGEVEIAGAEFTLAWVGAFDNGLSVPVNLAYTFTETAFQNSFQSNFSQWGLVRAGDELPYTPEHQGRIEAGLEYGAWALDLALKYIGRMREVPGQGEYEPRTSIDALTTLGISARYEMTPRLALRLVADNVTDERQIVSRRPFGARPNLPRTVRVGLNYLF